MALAIGSKATATLTVGGSDLATVLNQTSDDAFPPVLATARMIGLMELAASRAMRPILGEGELSVGVNIAVTHGAATPIGAQVTAEATFTGMQGKLYAFAGELESEEFHRQNQLIRHAWGAQRVRLCEVLPGRNHFSALEALAEPGNRLSSIALELVFS